MTVYHNHRTLFCTLTTLLCLTATAYSAPAERYSVQDLGVAITAGIDPDGVTVFGSRLVGPNQTAFLFAPSVVQIPYLPQGTFSLANHSDDGVVVGYSGTDNLSLHTHAFLYTNGTVRDLGTTGGTDLFSAATSSNAALTVSGYGDSVDMSAIVPLVWLGGQGPPDVLPTLGGLNGFADSVNEAGDVCGNSETADGKDHATAWFVDQTQPVDLHTLPGDFSICFKINEVRQAVGNVETGGSVFGYLWQQGTMLVLPPLADDTRSTARSINGVGDVVGDSWTPGPSGIEELRRRAVIYSNGQPLLLEDRVQGLAEDCDLNTAHGISENGAIAATGMCGTERHAFLLTPLSGAEVAAAPPLRLKNKHAKLGPARRPKGEGMAQFVARHPHLPEKMKARLAKLME